MSQFTFPPVTISSVGVDYEKANAATALPSTLAIIGGWTGTAITALKTAADGALQIDVESGHGLATEAKQDTIETTLTAIETDADTIAGAVSGTEMQVDVITSALPTGAATSALQSSSEAILTTINTSLDNIEADADTSAGAVKNIQSAQGTTDPGIPALVVRNDTLADLAGSDHDYAPLQVNATGALYTDVTNIIPGTGATNLGKAIQSAQGTTDTGVPALVVRNDTLADLSGADGDYAPIQVNADGAVYTTVSSGTINVGTVSGTVTVTGTNLKLGTANAGVNIGTVALSTSTGVDIGNVGLKAGTESVGTVILGTGSAQIGKLAANSGVDIGDVDVTSLPALAAGTNTIGKVDVNALAPVDFLDDGVLDASTDSINSTGGTIVVATALAAACTEIEVVDDIGEYMSIAHGTTKKAYLPLGGGRVKVSLAVGAPIRLYSETGTDITSGKIAINFLG